MDAFYLPDTAGTSYRTEHVKTSIGIQALDPEERRLGYFHNAGYYELAGDDFAGVFRLEGHLTDPEYLPPYVEVAKLGNQPPRTGRALVDGSLALLRAHLARRPADEPVPPLRRALSWRPGVARRRAALVLPQLCLRHAAAVRRRVRARRRLPPLARRPVARAGSSALRRAASVIATTAKALQFKTARAVNTRKPLDPAPMLDTMAAAWDETMTTLTARYCS